ncbi:class I SAM-dependent methyltransferase [Thermoactinomyces mirandus]|uniref:Methyltransferase domain-containing protein n=1 Tax=Thermoactinomyces mirandus TaxID=2756294 RepID=A0A7W1XRP8_9BACL|nr:methyltransferase domain-containing protein [Thermoactinomyces mirandus]MBA4601922.1 methyltransferase domain-containing protein [Thermoactinomyces mirandus]
MDHKKEIAHHFSNPELAVQEMHRVLKPKGIFILIDNVAPEEAETTKILHQIETLRIHPICAV